MGSKPKSPPPPDTVGAAKAEAQGNKEVAQITAGYNRPTQIDPYGMTTWTFRGQGAAPNPALQARLAEAQRAYDAAVATPFRGQPRDGDMAGQRAAYDANINTLRANLQAAQGAMGAGVGTPDNPRPGDWVQTTTLTPEQQAILNAEQANDLRLQQLAAQGIDIAGSQLATPFSTAGLPQLMGARGIGESQYAIPGRAGSNVGLPGVTAAGVQGPATTLGDMQRLSEDPNQFAQQRKDVSDALYRELTRFNDERFGREEAAERTRLSNMGFTQGTAAYDNALREFMRSKDESYASAADRALLAGGAEQSRLLSDLLASRQSNIGLGESQFGQNLARSSFDLERAGQEFQQGATRYGLDQGERDAAFQAGVNQYQLGLGERQAQQQSDLALAALQGQNRQQMFQEEAYKRGLPLSEIAQLMGNAGPQMPQFQPFSLMQPWQGPQLLDAEMGKYNAALGSSNLQNASRGQNMSTLGTLATAAATYFA